MKRPYKHPSVTPKRSGLYVRDYRGCVGLDFDERWPAVDLWLREERVWYVYPGPNDAAYQALPWREATLEDIARLYEMYPEARRWSENV